MPRFPNDAAALAFLITGALATSVAARAQGADTATEWKLYESPEACSIGGQPGAAFVFLSINPEGEQGLRVHHPDIAISEGEARPAMLTVGEVRVDLELRGARSTDGTPGITLRGRRDLRAALAAGPAATLAVPPGATLALDLTGLGEVLPLLDACTGRLKPRDPNSIVAIKARPTRMPGIAASQLPLDGAIRREVGFRLTVSREGKADNCEITRSSGSEQLDSKVCQLLIAGTRFTPARNAADKPVEGTYQSRVVF